MYAMDQQYYTIQHLQVQNPISIDSNNINMNTNSIVVLNQKVRPFHSRSFYLFFNTF